MKNRRILALLLCGFLVALALFLRDRAGRQEQSLVQDSLRDFAAAPLSGEAAALSAVPEKEAKEDAGSEAGKAEPAPVFFPSVKVVAKVVDPAQADGRFKEFETVETSMKERYVRVERTLIPDGAGKLRLVSEIAMVANQILLMRPEALDAAKFQEVLRQAGAIEVKPVGEAFLATFEARPQDPKALDSYIAKVREVAQTDISIEPNYIRKMF
jgi:hypothetical protein